MKSDAAGEILKAVEDLGWHSDSSLANRWPHNAVHERWHGTFKSILRSSILQSGFPVAAWHLAASYAAIALSVTKSAPLLPWELNAAGLPLEAAKTKSKQTCWECHHGGEQFTGPIQPFGRLCSYWDKGPESNRHPVSPNKKHGLFIGWRLDLGLRYRGILLMLDYDKAEKKDFRRATAVKHVPACEVTWPEIIDFPFYNRALLDLRNMTKDSPLQFICCILNFTLLASIPASSLGFFVFALIYLLFILFQQNKLLEF